MFNDLWNCNYSEVKRWKKLGLHQSNHATDDQSKNETNMEGGKEGERERVRVRERKTERDSEWKWATKN